MADKKISELDAVTDVQDTDEYVLARSGASKKITGASLRSEIGGSSSFLSTTVNVTDAQVKLLPLPDEVVEIIPAPGAGRVILPIQGIMHLKNWHADYGNIDPTCVLQLDVSSTLLAGLFQEQVTGFVTTFLAGGGPDGTWAIAPMAGKAAGNVAYGNFLGDAGWYDADIVNQPLKLYSPNFNGGAGPFTGGDPAQSVDVTIVYQILDAT